MNNYYQQRISTNLKKILKEYKNENVDYKTLNINYTTALPNMCLWEDRKAEFYVKDTHTSSTYKIICTKYGDHITKIDTIERCKCFNIDYMKMHLIMHS